MSGSSRRRNSKWDNKDSEDLLETFHDRARAPKPREPLSPSRGSWRHESRSRERIAACDREGNGKRMSPGLDEWRRRNHSRSPGNGWVRSHRGSRSRSRSRSPTHNFRRDPVLNDKSSFKSGVSAKICRDFASGRCRRGNNCQFLHHDAQPYEGRRPSESSPPDDWESRNRRSEGSRYAPPDGNKDYGVRGDNRSTHICNDFVKGKCRRGSSCRYPHHDTNDAYRDRDSDHRGRDTYPDEKKPVDDIYGDRDNDHKNRETYPDRNHDREPPQRGEPLCKYFAAGNCRNGVRCRFSHQVQEVSSPERRSLNDRRGPDHTSEGGQVWDGPRWSDDATKVSNVAVVKGWGEDPNEIRDVAKDVNTTSSGDDIWTHGMVDMEQTWDLPAVIDDPKIKEKNQPLQWNLDRISPSRGINNFSGDMEISPSGILKQHDFSSSNLQTSYLSNVGLPAIQQDPAGKASYEKHYTAGFDEHKVFNDPFSVPNPNFKEDRPTGYLGDDRNAIENSDNSFIPPNPTMNIPQGQGIFQTNQIVNNQPISSITPPSGSHAVNLNGTSALSTGPATSQTTVSSEQLAQLSHLTASLAQLIESRQQLPILGSTLTPHNSMSNPTNSVASIPPVSSATFQPIPIQATETLKPYDPLCDSIEPKVPNLGNHKGSDIELHNESGDVHKQEPLVEFKDDENSGKKDEEKSKAPEHGPSEDMVVDDGANNDGKKSKDAKGIRPFKFALAEFVKELLKPTWKDGQISKDVYKTIVKKVVDKVIETQGPQIPQTKEKIDQYLSASKPKLDKLVLAYVGKYQKSSN